jgi:two-component system, cell cycle sensor histidine kinase and response regulator CckA
LASTLAISRRAVHGILRIYQLITTSQQPNCPPTVSISEISSLMLTYLGQTPGEREPLNLSEACNRALSMIRTSMPKEVDLKADLPCAGPTINANAHQIQQVLTNQATYAWEALGEGGGAIHLAVKTFPPADIPATHRFPVDWQPQDNLYACLEVTDAGCGISEKDIEKIFDPFFTAKFTGRGLGLPVVLGIIRAHSGAVTVEREAGRGTVFRVFWPVSAEEVPRQPEQAAKASEIEGGGTVLLVEDEQMVREMAKAMLMHLGFAVLEAKDGIEAVEVFRQHKDTIRCVLSDLNMPRMDGWETLAALRQLAPGIPVVLASGYDQAQVMAGDHSEWGQAFLGKPFRSKGLSDAIRQALENKRAGGPT